MDYRGCFIQDLYVVFYMKKTVRTNMKKRALFLFQAQIDPRSGGILCDKLETCINEGCSEVFILLNSPGGSLRIALGILNFLELLPLKITTCNMSSCDSAAILLFLAGEKRICTPESRFWLHPVYKESPIVHTEDELQVELNCLRQDNQAVAEAIAARTNKNVQIWSTAMSNKTFVSAEDAKKLGLVHSIGQITSQNSDKFYTIC